MKSEDPDKPTYGFAWRWKPYLLAAGTLAPPVEPSNCGEIREDMTLRFLMLRSDERALREFPFFLGRFMTQVEHDISDFEEAGEAVPGGVPERQWHHHVEDDEL